MVPRYCWGQAMPRSFARRVATLVMCSLSKSARTAIFANASSNACTRMRRLPRPTTSFSPGHRTTSEWQSAQLCHEKRDVGVRIVGQVKAERQPFALVAIGASAAARRWVKPKRSASACGVAPRSSGVHLEEGQEDWIRKAGPVRVADARPLEDGFAFLLRRALDAVLGRVRPGHVDLHGRGARLRADLGGASHA